MRVGRGGCNQKMGAASKTVRLPTEQTRTASDPTAVPATSAAITRMPAVTTLQKRLTVGSESTGNQGFRVGLLGADIARVKTWADNQA